MKVVEFILAFYDDSASHLMCETMIDSSNED